MPDLFVYYGKDQTKYPAVECSCVVCGKAFLRGMRWLERTPISTCSKACNLEYRAIQRQKKKQDKLNSWLAEKPTCATCGKLMTSMFGSGKYCSRTCANSREHSAFTKNKIASSLNTFYNSIDLSQESDNKAILQIQQARLSYELAPRVCAFCGSSLPYEKRHRKTCDDDCYRALASSNAKKNDLGGKPGIGNCYGKRGFYKGIQCDSSYELVFLIYCLDHNIKIERSKPYFIYEFEGRQRKYYPDFYLPETDTLIELKGYKDARVDLKLQSVIEAGKTIKILYKQDLLPYFEYVGKTYHKKYNPNDNNLEQLYDEVV